ncbi:MAG: hypothetical protein V1679_00775 [Candidatus Peregrinibacteria bacterium]
MQKKIFKGFVVLAVMAVVVALFTMCSFWRGGVGDVSKVVFFVNPGALGPEYYFESVLEVVPDYELRTLAVDYKYEFPLSDDRGKDIASEGVVGGEFFDRFEGVLNVLEDYKVVKEDIVGAGVFDVTVVNKNKEIKYNFHTGIEDEDFKFLEDFQKDLEGVFLEEVY